MTKRFLTALALLLGTLSVNSQEYKASLPAINSISSKGTIRLATVSSTLSLPFIDDFSYDSNLPDESLWESRGVWINNNMGIGPYSVGVATFDAIDVDGLHYSHASSTPYMSDYLTSNRIDLSNADSTTTYLSFYYQPQGNGNAPEECDSLVLQINSGDGVWTNIWSCKGMDYETFKSEVLHIKPGRPDTLEFALVNLPIKKSKYFTDKFQFRFFNYASLAGNYNPSGTINCDHWNIDFVYLNDGRSANDTTFYDIAFIQPAVTVLKNFTSIPWKHYNSAINTENTRVAIHLRNHWERDIKAEVRIRIKDVDNDIYLNDSVTLGTANYESQYDTKMTHSYDENPIVYDNGRNNATYLFECEILSDKDELIKGNNKCYTYQHFGNYYSYDDGTAENAYGVDANSSQVAYLYNTYKADKLYGISICFLPTNPIESASDGFYICAWENVNGKPGKQLRCDEATRPAFSGEMNEFMTFAFNEPLDVEKSVFIGWQQTSALRLNVGWDANRYSQSKIFYNTTGNWLNTSFSGSLMMRPLFGSLTDDIAESAQIEQQLTIYPNPANDIITIEGLEDDDCEISIINTLGQTLLRGTDKQYNVSSLNSGIYFVNVRCGGNTSVLKFIKR